MTAELTIVVPALNENENVGPLKSAIEKVLEGVSWEIIFVDDDSADGTPDTIREMARRDPRVRCVQRIGRRGLSSACIEGMLASASPFMVVMDADLQHDESLLPDMLALIKGEDLDIVSPSRFIGGGSTGELASDRVRVSRFATNLGKSFLKVGLTDPMSGFFMLRREFFEKTVRKLSGKGFKILLDLFLSADSDVRYREIPYTMRARGAGESKLDTLVALEYAILLADKFFGWAIPMRYVLFCLVGLTGAAVHLTVLGVLFETAGLAFVLSQTIAVIVSMTTNYYLNNIFTYRDHRQHGADFFTGLVKFYLACTIGAIFNIWIAQYLFGLGYAWWLAGSAGIFVGSIWNFAVTSAFIWLRPVNRN